MLRRRVLVWLLSLGQITEEQDGSESWLVEDHEVQPSYWKDIGIWRSATGRVIALGQPLQRPIYICVSVCEASGKPGDPGPATV